MTTTLLVKLRIRMLVQSPKRLDFNKEMQRWCLKLVICKLLKWKVPGYRGGCVGNGHMKHLFRYIEPDTGPEWFSPWLTGSLDYTLELLLSMATQIWVETLVFPWMHVQEFDTIRLVQPKVQEVYPVRLFLGLLSRYTGIRYSHEQQGTSQIRILRWPSTQGEVDSRMLPPLVFVVLLLGSNAWWWWRKERSWWSLKYRLS